MPISYKKVIGDCELNPNGNLWYHDEDGYGFKMLRKMGWKKNKGLGKFENGITERIKIKVKNNAKGVGFKDKHNIGVHSSNYNQLLNSLNESYPTLNEASGNTPNETTSLVQRSKQSQNHLHYQKFVRGEDVSRYSKKDMDSIFGTKNNVTIPVEDKESKMAVVSEEYTNVDDVTQKMFTEFKSPLSVQEYFASRKETLTETISEGTVEIKNDPSNDVRADAELNTSKKKKRSKNNNKKNKKAKLDESTKNEPTTAPENNELEEGEIDECPSIELANQDSPDSTCSTSTIDSSGVSCDSDKVEHDPETDKDKTDKPQSLIEKDFSDYTQVPVFPEKTSVYTQWLQEHRDSQSQGNRGHNVQIKKLHRKIRRHRILKTTNLNDIKGYGQS